MICQDDCFSVLFAPLKTAIFKRKRRQLRRHSVSNDESEKMDEKSSNSETAPPTIPPYQNWKLKVRKYQQCNYNSLGDRYWDIVEDDLLDKKIGFALYGIPMEKKGSNSITYSDDKVSHINKLKQHILSLRKDDGSSQIYIACIFVYVRSKDDDNKEGVEVLFRIPKVLNENLDVHLFVDSTCRTYKGWDDYLRNNKLPKCDMCFPFNGVYTAENGSVEIGFRESPACEVSKTIFTGLDITSSVLGIGATGVGLAALAIPVAAPFIWGATATVLASGAYDIGRSINKLVDIGTHYESLSFKNPDSRKVWLSLAGTTVGVASVGGLVISKGVTMAGGQVISRGEAFALRIINMSSLAINGISGLNSLITIVIKFLDGSLELTDVLQFSSACYFFLNAILSIKMANRLIEEIASSSDFSTLFYTRKNTVFDFSKSALEFTESNTYNVLRTLVLGAQSQLMPDINLNDLECIAFQLITLINKLSSGMISWSKFSIEIIGIVENIWIKFKDVILKATDELSEVFNVNDWKAIFVKPSHKPMVNNNPDVARQLCMATHKAIEYCDVDDPDKHFMRDIINLSNTFISLHPPDCSIDFLNKSKFVCEYLIKEFDSMRDEYELTRDVAESNSKEFNKLTFDRSYGIEENKDIRFFFFEKALNRLQTEKSLNKMHSAYSELSKICDHNQGESPCMETSISCHYIFSGPPGQKVLTEEQYWQKANEITGLNLSRQNATLLKQNNIVLIRPSSEDFHIKALFFYSTTEKDSVMGILTVIKGDNTER